LNVGLGLVGFGAPVSVPDATACICMETDEEGGMNDCMFLTTLANLDAACLGCVGTKGEKFCTKVKIGASKTGAVSTHTQKR
jgi:hypothetical protein